MILFKPYRSACLRKVRVSKEAKCNEEYKVVEFLLYFQCIVEKMLKIGKK